MSKHPYTPANHPAWEYILHYMERESYPVGPLRSLNRYTWSYVVPLTGRKMSSNVVVLGPHRCGKSTLVGRTLCDTGTVAQKDMLKIYNEWKNFMRCDMDRYRFLMDRCKNERENGLTIDISRCCLEFKRNIMNMIQVPGRKKYIRNRIAGISQADSVLLVVAASDFNEDMDQIKDALRTSKVFDLRTVIVAVTKMDLLPPDSMEDTFGKIRDTIYEFCSKVKFRKEQILGIVPVSAKTGANITQPGGYEWYTGPTLHHIMGDMVAPIRECNKPLRISVDKAYLVPSVGLIITGTILQGVVHNGQYAKLGPSNKIIRIKSLHLAVPRKPITLGMPGDYVGLNVSGASHSDVNRRRLGVITGFLGPKEKAAHMENLKIPTLSPVQYAREAPLHKCSLFLAQVFFFGLKKKIVPLSGMVMVMHCHNAQVEVSISKSKAIYTPRIMTTQPTEEASLFSNLPTEVVHTIFSQLPNPFVFQVLPGVSKYFYHMATHPGLWDNICHRDNIQRYPSLDLRNSCLPLGLNQCQGSLENDQMSFLELRPKKPLAVDTHANCSKLGRFLLRDGVDVFAAGLILNCTYT